MTGFSNWRSGFGRRRTRAILPSSLTAEIEFAVGREPRVHLVGRSANRVDGTRNVDPHALAACRTCIYKSKLLPRPSFFAVGIGRVEDRFG